MLGSRVLSRQFVLWLLPLVPLVGKGFVKIIISAVFLATCGSTRLLLRHYSDLLELRFLGLICWSPAIYSSFFSGAC